MIDTTREILKKLDQIQVELATIKESLPDKDMFLTAEEERLLEESYEHEKSDELISSKDLRKELGI